MSRRNNVRADGARFTAMFREVDEGTICVNEPDVKGIASGDFVAGGDGQAEVVPAARECRLGNEQQWKEEQKVLQLFHLCPPTQGF